MGTKRILDVKKISDQYQIILPMAVRDAIGVTKGDHVVFIETEHGVIIKNNYLDEIKK